MLGDPTDPAEVSAGLDDLLKNTAAEDGVLSTLLRGAVNLGIDDTLGMGLGGKSFFFYLMVEGVAKDLFLSTSKGET